MFVELGNADPIEGYRDEGSDEVKYRAIESDAEITHIHFPDGHSVRDAFTDVLNTLPRHFAEGAKPVWVHSDSPGLQALLEEEFAVKKQKPAKWGRFKRDETPGLLMAYGDNPPSDSKDAE